MNKPLVSVIMPVKNGERFLQQSIESILNQDYPSKELIIVDGQSTDNTRQIARSYDQVKYIYQDENPGIPQAKNIGIQTASGEFIGFASHDDLWISPKLSRQVEYIIESNVQYTITRVKFFLEPGSQIRPGFNSSLLNGDYIGKMPETLVARKSLFDTIGIFSTEFTYMEDIDWFNRAEQHNIPMGIIEEVLLYKRVHDHNVSYDPLKISRINREILYLLKQSIDRNAVLLRKNSRESPNEQ